MINISDLAEHLAQYAEYAFAYKDREELERVLKEYFESLNNGWISVSERLPEKDGEYLCTTVYGNVTDIWIDTFYKGEWTRPADVEFDYEIIAWQPLPEPWKESVKE